MAKARNNSEPAAKRTKALAADIPEVNVFLDEDKRPLAGPDIERFRARHRLSIADVTYALAMQSSGLYGAANREPIMSVAREMLIRIYNRYPNHPTWREVTPRDGFLMLYGDILEYWKNTPHYNDARLALFGRYAALFGRAWCNAYRWVEKGGNVKPEINRLLAKLADLPNPREVAESVGRKVLGLRGIDLDAEYPLPLPGGPPPAPRQRGRKRKNATETGAPGAVKKVAAKKVASKKAKAKAVPATA